MITLKVDGGKSHRMCFGSHTFSSCRDFLCFHRPCCCNFISMFHHWLSFVCYPFQNVWFCQFGVVPSTSIIICLRQLESLVALSCVQSIYHYCQQRYNSLVDLFLHSLLCSLSFQFLCMMPFFRVFLGSSDLVKVVVVVKDTTCLEISSLNSKPCM